MRRGIACAVLMMALTWAGTASASTLCVPNINIPACHGTGANEPTISDAIMNASNGDTIFIGADSSNAGHPYNETINDGGKSLTFIGAGVGKTVVQGQGVTAFTASSGSSVSKLTINLAAGTGNSGLQLAGTATNVAVTATNPLSTKDNIGVALTGGTLSHSTVSLPVSGGDDYYYGGVIGAGVVSDSAITAAVGATDDMSAGMPTLSSRPHPRQPGRRGWRESFDRRRLGDQDGGRCPSAVGAATSPQSMFSTMAIRHVDSHR